MNVTNKKGLPDSIVQAVKNDYYTKGDAKFSVTGLLQPPQVRQLMSNNYDKLTTDVSDEIWKLFGSAVHHILDRAQGRGKTSVNDIKISKISLFLSDWVSAHQGIEANYYDTYKGVMDIIQQDYDVEEEHIITEERLYLTVGDIRISGATDWYNKITKIVEDYKVTSTYKVTKGDHSDWEAQLNVYALLLINAGYPVEKLQINAILKDWSRREYVKWSKSEGGYPDCPVEVVDIPLWKPMDTLKWLIAKIEDQMLVDGMANSEDIYNTRPCTPDDKWQSATKYALMKKGGKRASAVFDNEVEANGASFAKGSDYNVEVRPGYAIRCEEYCLVKDFCFQYKIENENEVTYEAMQTDALKSLEVLVPEKEKDIKEKPKEKKEWVNPTAGQAIEAVDNTDLYNMVGLDSENPDVIIPKKPDNESLIDDLINDL